MWQENGGQESGQLKPLIGGLHTDPLDPPSCTSSIDKTQAGSLGMESQLRSYSRIRTKILSFLILERQKSRKPSIGIFRKSVMQLKFDN